MLIINGLKRSLQVELPHFFEHFSAGLSCSKQAFCEQRVKLKPQFFHDLNQVLVSGFYRSYDKNVKRWKGMEVYAVDGSSVPLPETEDLRKTFGGVTNQRGEQVSATARICVLYDVLCHSYQGLSSSLYGFGGGGCAGMSVGFVIRNDIVTV